MPGQHGAQRGQAEKQHRQQQHRQHRVDDCHQIEEPPEQGDQAQEQAHYREGDQYHGQPR